MSNTSHPMPDQNCGNCGWSCPDKDDELWLVCQCENAKYRIPDSRKIINTIGQRRKPMLRYHGTSCPAWITADLPDPAKETWEHNTA